MGPRGGDILGLKRLLEEQRSGRTGRDTGAESWCGLPIEVRGSEKAPPHSLAEHSTMHRLLENVPDGGGERAEAASG